MRAILLVLAVALLGGDLFTSKDWLDMWQRGGVGDWASLARQDVRDDLGLSKETCDKIDGMFKTFREERSEMMKKPEGERHELIVKHKKEYLEKAKTLLGPEKFGRLMEIHAQMLGNSAIGEPYFQKLLGVDGEQRARARAADDAYNQQLSGLLYQIQEDQLPIAEIEKGLEQLETMLSSDCAVIFTKEQAAKFADLKGKRFAIKSTPLWWRMVRR